MAIKLLDYYRDIEWGVSRTYGYKTGGMRVEFSTEIRFRENDAGRWFTDSLIMVLRMLSLDESFSPKIKTPDDAMTALAYLIVYPYDMTQEVLHFLPKWKERLRDGGFRIDQNHYQLLMSKLMEKLDVSNVR